MFTESPLFQEAMAKKFQECLLDVLEGRFGNIPDDLAASVRGVEDNEQLRRLIRLASVCPNLDTIRAVIPGPARVS